MHHPISASFTKIAREYITQISLDLGRTVALITTEMRLYEYSPGVADCDAYPYITQLTASYTEGEDMGERTPGIPEIGKILSKEKIYK